MRFKSNGVTIGGNASLHKSVDVQNPRNVFIGEASVIYKNTSIYPGENGKFRIGKNSHIAPFGYLLIDKNTLEIGDNVAVGPFCTFICHSNNIEGENELFTKNYLDGDIKLGDNIFIGAQCTILPGTVIEDNVVIASNSVVKGRLNSNYVYGGSPAKEIKAIKG